MKRPLCVASIVITVIVYLYLQFFDNNFLYDYSNLTDKSEITLIGVVTGKEFTVGYTGEIIPVVYILPYDDRNNKEKKQVKCEMSTDDYIEPAIGEYIKIHGRVRLFGQARNPGEFDSHLYYSTINISYSIKEANILARGGKEDVFHEALYKIRMNLEEKIDIFLPEKDSAVMKAILLGDKAYMDREMKELYQSSGIIHILAVSGLHISILGMGMYRLLRKMRLKTLHASIISVLVMYSYGLMCGMSSSAYRAIVMFSIRLLAQIVGRTYDILSSLSIVEMMLLIEQPLLVYNSGFLFSFGAVAGIAYVMKAFDFEYMKDLFVDKRKMKFSDDEKEKSLLRKFAEIVLNHINSGLLAGFSVFLVTLPVYMSFYFSYPIYSFLLNLIVLPLMAPLMILGVICIIGGSLFVPIGKSVGVFVSIILWLYRFLCGITSHLPGKTFVTGHTSSIKIFIYFVAIFVFVATFKKIKNIYRNMLLVFAVLFMLINISPDLMITAMDVGQGDGILVKIRREALIIDSGSTSKKNVGRYTVLPYLKYEGIGRIKAMIMTHEDEDHISGMFEIMDSVEKNEIKVENLVLPDVGKASRGDNYLKLEERAHELGIKISYISCGQKIVFDGLELLCLNPTKGMETEGANAYSTVLYMKYGDFTALFTGDVEKEGQEHILEDIRKESGKYSDITLLKVAHHGSRYTSDEEFLELISPKIALISCGIDNRYSHPHKEVLERLSKVGSVVYRTDESGAVRIFYSKRRKNVRINKYCG